MQAIPLAFFLFVIELAAGGLIVTAILDWDGEVSAGFLFLNGLFLLGFLALGVWLRAVLPAEQMVEYAASNPWLRTEVAAYAAVALLAAAQLFLLRTDRRWAGRLLGTVTAVASLLAIGWSGAAYAAQDTGTVRMLLALLGGALALGTAWGGMMLGHWYLVTPRLAPRPLLRLNAAMALVLAAQAILFIGTMLWGAIDPEVLWLFWLRAAVGIAFPLALAVPIWRTARVRSMMSATGLLYIALGLVLSGEIIARALFFLTGIPV